MAKKFVLTSPDAPVRATEWKLVEVFVKIDPDELSYWFESPEGGRVTVTIVSGELQGAETAAFILLRNAGVRLLSSKLGFVGSEVEE